MSERVHRELQLDRPPERVWPALTDPAWLSQWLAEEVAWELHPGGEARFLVEGEERSGWIEEISRPQEDRPGRLTFWWQGDHEPASRVELVLEATEAGARLRVTESQPLEVLDLVGTDLDSLGGGAPRGPLMIATCA